MIFLGSERLGDFVMNKLVWLALPALMVAPPALAGSKELQAEVVNVDAPPAGAFTDSSAAGLAATKRVAISSVVIAFQTSTGAKAGAHFFIPKITARNDVLTVMAMPSMSAELQETLAAAAYAQLAAELKAQGFEVLPQEQVTASANYRAILQQAGYSNHSRFANAMGDIELVGPEGLQPYTAYQGEIGAFQYPSMTYLNWISAFGGKSVTPGGPSIIQQGNAWKVPGLEVALAKELNAHVVKAYYVVSLGKAAAKRHTDFSVSDHSGFFTASDGSLMMGNYKTLDRTVTGTGTALAQVGLVSEQSHIAFRAPNGNAKWQKVSMLAHAPAPKDGDVVVRLETPLFGSTDFFSVSEGASAKMGSGLFSAAQKGDLNVNFTARITDPVGYGKEVSGMIAAANRAMLGLVKQP
jgi:hypothetical protein